MSDFTEEHVVQSNRDWNQDCPIRLRFVSVLEVEEVDVTVVRSSRLSVWGHSISSVRLVATFPA